MAKRVPGDRRTGPLAAGLRRGPAPSRVCSTSRPICSTRASTRVEALLAAEPLDEPDLGRLAVEVAVEVEEMGLEQRHLGVHVEGRAAPERDRGRPLHAVGVDVRAGVDAVGRQAQPGRDGDVGRGEPELPAPPVAGLDRRRGPRGDAAGGRRGGPPPPLAPRRAAAGSRSTSTAGRSPRPRPAPARGRAPRTRARRPSARAGARCRGAGSRSGSRRRRSRAGRRGCSTSTSRTKSSAGSWLRDSSKVSTTVRSRKPVAPRSSTFCSSVVSSFGALSGRTTSAGWRSKVRHTASRPRVVGELAHEAEHGLVPEVHAVVRTDRDGRAACGSA